MRASVAFALLLVGCSARTLEVTSPDLAVSVGVDPDLSIAADLAQPIDLAGVDFGPKRHLFESCDFDEQCLSGDCVFAGESHGWLDHVCGQACGVVGQPSSIECIEGVCFSFDADVYWCLPTCVPTMQNKECPEGLVCCSGGDDTSACVPSAALACEPR